LSEELFASEEKVRKLEKRLETLEAENENYRSRYITRTHNPAPFRIAQKILTQKIPETKKKQPHMAERR